MVFNFSLSTITCEFASGSDAVGCQVSLNSQLVINITRGPDVIVATQSINVSEDLFTEMVTVAEILVDGSVCHLTIQAEVTTVTVTTVTTVLSPRSSKGDIGVTIELASYS